MEAKEDYKHHYDKKTRSRIFKVGRKVNILLPTDHNKLLLQWKGSYDVVEVLNRINYKADVNGKKKVLHANLLKLYIPRDDSDQTGDTDEVDAAASVAIIEPGDEDGVVDDKRLLDLLNVRQRETYNNVNVSPDLSPGQIKDVWCLLEEFQDIFNEQ